MYYQLFFYPQIDYNLESIQNYNQDFKTNEIIVLIEKLLSFENLNKDIFIRSYINQNGFITINNIQKVKQIKNLNLTYDEITSIVLNYPSNIFETHFDNYEVVVRNKKWFEMKKYLFSIEDIVKNKVNKIQNYYLTKYPIQSKMIKPMERRKKRDVK